MTGPNRPETLSDELLAMPERLAAVRERLNRLVEEIGGTGGFLVDEGGAPFAGVGPLTFTWPHPLASLPGGDGVLSAMVGETSGEASSCLVERLGARALVVVVLDAALPQSERARGRRVMRRGATDLEALF